MLFTTLWRFKLSVDLLRHKFTIMFVHVLITRNPSVNDRLRDTALLSAFGDAA